MRRNARPEAAQRPRVAADFEGAWRLERHIVHADGSEARFDGKAVWQREGDLLRYTESGVLEMPGRPPMRAGRAYLWGPDLTVRFEDGRLFHRVPAAGGRAEHRCDPDHYSADYDFTAWPLFRVVWHVIGPRKDYVMTSVYSRR